LPDEAELDEEVLRRREERAYDEAAIRFDRDHDEQASSDRDPTDDEDWPF